MALFQPTNNELQFEIDSEVFHAWFEVARYLESSVLYLSCECGSGSIEIKDESDLRMQAERLFQEVIRKNYTPIQSLDPRLPEPIRNTAYLYANRLERALPDRQDYLLSHALVDSFGNQSVGSFAHRQVSWLCLNALKCVIEAWLAYCDDPSAFHNYEQLVSYMNEGSIIDDWDALCKTPMAIKNGHEIGDCTACTVEPIAEGVANAARYIRFGQPLDAGESLWNSQDAQDQGACRLHEQTSFQRWIALVALPAAYECREVASEALYGQ